MTHNTPGAPGIASDILSLRGLHLPNILKSNDHTSVSIREALSIMQDPVLQPAYAAVQSARLFGSDDDYKAAKLRLPAFCLQGTVGPGKALSAANLKHPTGIMVLDCDHRPDADEVLAAVCQSPHVAFAFKSPSGEGVKIGVHVGIPEAVLGLPVSSAAYSNYYKQVQAQAVVWWPWLETDNSSCNINRLCFASPHPAYINEAAVPVGVLPYVAPVVVDRGDAQYTDEQVDELLSKIDPGVSREVWLRVLMACHYNNSASLHQVNDWSSGGANYAGFEDVQKIWESLEANPANPVTMKSLERLARLEDQKTLDWSAVVPVAQSEFNRGPEPMSDANALGLFTPDEQWMLDNVYILKEGNSAFYIKESADTIGALNRFDLAFGKMSVGRTDNTKPSKWLANQNDCKVVSGTGWEPSLAPKDIIELEGKTYVNTYKHPTTAPKRNDAVLGRWLQLMRVICGEQTDLVLDHLAFSCQKPEDKIRWQVLIHGAPRTGKTLAFRPLGQVFKGSIGLMDTDSDNHAWGDAYKENKFVIFEEVHNQDTKHFNSLKTKLANDDVESLNIKGKTIHTQRNVYSMYLFSNSDTALRFDADQDKLLVIKTPNTTFDEAFFNSLADDDMKHPDFAGAFYWYMLNRDVSGFSSGRLPIRTKAMEDMVAASKPDAEQYLIEVLEDDKGPFTGEVTTEQDITNWFKQRGLKVIGRRPLEDILLTYGWMRCRGRIIEPGNKTKRHSFIGRIESCESMNARELYEYYEVNSALFPER